MIECVCMFDYKVVYLSGLYVKRLHCSLLLPVTVVCWSQTGYVPPITFLSKCPAALNAAETLWVPVLIQSSDHFLNEKRIKESNVFKRDEIFH